MPQLTAQDLLPPTGEIDSKLLFPGAKSPDVMATLEAWLGQAYATLPAETVDNVGQVNTGARHYAYYMAYAQAHRRMALTPLRSSVANEATDGYDFAQIREVAAIAAEHLDRYNAILGSFSVIVETSSARVSQAVPAKFRF